MKTNYTVFKDKVESNEVLESESNLEYREAKQLQMNWANLELTSDLLDRPMKEATVDCVHCRVHVVKTDLFEKYQDGEIEFYEMFE